MSRLYTYLPKDNTALTEGLLSTALSDKGFEKYRGRTGKYKKEDVLKVLDSWEPGWTRSKAISALTEPIPPDAAEDFLEFARNRKLYSFSVKDLIKAKILAHLRRTRKGGGTDPIDGAKEEKIDWNRKKKHLLFQGIPHYMVETTGGRIPPELITEEKKAEMTYMDKIASVAIASLAYGAVGQEKQAVVFSPDRSTFTLAKGETPSHVAPAYNKLNPSAPITTSGVLTANKGVPATKFRTGVAYPTGITPAVKPASKPAPKPAASNAVAQATGPVGFRNNNPLNLKSDGKTKWNGSTGVPTKGNFLGFNNYSSGIRAGARTLYNYGKLHGIDTVNGVLNRFAPVKDKNRNNANYASHIQKRTGIAPDQKINLTDEATLQKLVPAMGSFEIGPRFFNTYNTSSVSNAVHSAIPPSIVKAK